MKTKISRVGGSIGGGIEVLNSWWSSVSAKQNYRAMGKKLSKRERDFCHHLAETGQLKVSSILAGFAPAGAATQATRMMRRQRVKDYYERLLTEQMSAGVSISKDAVKAKLVVMINSDTVSNKDKLTALTMICKLNRYFDSPISKMEALTPSEIREAIQLATKSTSGLPLQIEG